MANTSGFIWFQPPNFEWQLGWQGVVAEEAFPAATQGTWGEIGGDKL